MKTPIDNAPHSSPTATVRSIGAAWNHSRPSTGRARPAFSAAAAVAVALIAQTAPELLGQSWAPLEPNSSADSRPIATSRDTVASAVDPTPLTSSGPPCDGADDANEQLFNPIPLGRWWVAPGCNTQVAVHDDVIVDGRIITGENPSVVRIGMLVPAVQRVRESAARLQFPTAPDALTSHAQFHSASAAAQRSRVTSLSVTFDASVTLQKPDRASFYTLSTRLPGVQTAAYEGYRGGVRVAVGDLEGDAAPFVVERLPDTIEVRSGPHVRVFDGSAGTALSWILRYDTPVRIRYFNGRLLTADELEITRSLDGAYHQNNLKQIGLASHTFAAAGVEQMILKPDVR